MSTNFFNSLDIASLRKGELGIFCGAGISRNAGIPVANTFLDYILTQFGISVEEKNILLNDNQPFEKYIETLLRQNGENAKNILFNAFDNDYLELSPTASHHWIASLASLGKLNFICTTNFDTLLETALKEQKVAYELYCTDLTRSSPMPNNSCKDCEGICKIFQKIDWDSDTLKLIKIHGCVQDRDNMAITIKNIASREILETRSEIIKQMFSNAGTHRKILIMGYSSSDSFDIVPVFSALKVTPKTIYYLNHGNSNKESELQKVINIRDLTESFNPFKKINGTHFWLCTDTNIIVNESTRMIGPSEQKWKECVNDYVKTFEAGQVEFLVALLFRRSNYFEKSNSNNGIKIALKYYDQAQLKFKHRGYYFGVGSCYNNAGVILKNIGRLPQALKKYRQAANLFRRDKQWLNQGKAIGNEANIYRHLGDFEAAMKFHKKAMRLFKKVSSDENISICYSDIALTYAFSKNYKKAVFYHNKELKLCRALGDIEGLAEGLVNLSAVFRSMGRTRKALILANKAETTFIETKNDQKIAACYISKAITYHALGKNELSLKLHAKGLEICERYSDHYNSLLSFSSLFLIFKEANRIKEADQLVRKSMRLAKKIGYTFMEKELASVFGVNQIQ